LTQEQPDCISCSKSFKEISWIPQWSTNMCCHPVGARCSHLYVTCWSVGH